MKRVFLALIFLLLMFGVYWIFLKKKDNGPAAPKDAPIAIGARSAAFNNSLDSLLNNYFQLKEAFVNSDSIAVKTLAGKLFTLIDAIPLNEIKKDTSAKQNAAVLYSTDSISLADVKYFTDSLTKSTDLVTMRHAFSSINEDLYSFLKGINYSGKNLYWQNCPMAFGDDQGADWISDTLAIRNPYLGHKMLTCGDTKDTIKAKQ